MRASHASVGTRETPSANSRGLAPTTKFDSCLVHRRSWASARLSVTRCSRSAGSPRITANATQWSRTGRSRIFIDLQLMIKQRVWDTRRFALSDEIVSRKMLIQRSYFCWSDWKPTSLYMTCCSDFEVTGVVDPSIGSAAVAICALYNQCHDVGACYNNPNMVWVRCLLQQCFMALVSDGKTKVDGEIVKHGSACCSSIAPVVAVTQREGSL